MKNILNYLKEWLFWWFSNWFHLCNLSSSIKSMELESGPLNVFNKPIEPCSMQPLTGFYRDGCCRSGEEDLGNTGCVLSLHGNFLNFLQVWAMTWKTKTWIPIWWRKTRWPMVFVGWMGLTVQERLTHCAWSNQQEYSEGGLISGFLIRFIFFSGKIFAYKISGAHTKSEGQCKGQSRRPKRCWQYS